MFNTLNITKINRYWTYNIHAQPTRHYIMILHSSVLDEEFHDIQMIVGGGEVKRKCPRKRLRVRRLSTSGHLHHEPFEHAQMSVAGSQVDYTGAGCVDVADIAVGVRQQPLQGVNVADRCCVVGRCGSDSGLCRWFVGRQAAHLRIDSLFNNKTD